MAGPWDVVSTAPAAGGSGADPWAVVSTKPVGAAAPAKLPLSDEPGYYYGSVLPFRVKQTPQGEDIPGTQQLAVPEIIRAPVRGIASIGGKLTGTIPSDPTSKTLTPDETAALSIGAGVSPASAEAARIGTSLVSAKPTALAREAHEAGYILPPVEAAEGKPTILSRLLSGVSGKIKTQQAASERNQEVTNQLARRALGLPENTVLTDSVFNNVRAQAGKAYEAVKTAVPEIEADEQYNDAVAALGGANSQAAKYFPAITKNPEIHNLIEELQQVQKFPTEAGVEVVKELRFNANANLKAVGDPSKHALGLAQREAANTLDDLMDRRISESGQPGVVDAYRAARRLIAKAYDLEGATNTVTGDVSARGVARLADRGRPLTDEMNTIARVAKAFPKAMQNPAAYGRTEDWSALDFFGSAGAVAAGHPSAALAIFSRPISRATILSNRYQNMMMNPPPGMPSTALVNPAIAGVLAGATNGMPQGNRP